MCGILFVLLASGCESQQELPMTLNEILIKYDKAPVGESLVPVTRALATASVIVPLHELPSSESGKLSLKVSIDNRGQPWAYVYTDSNEFYSTFPEGGPFAEMKFVEVFEIVAADEKFGGSFINRTPELMYLIPRELFAQVTETLAE